MINFFSSSPFKAALLWIAFLCGIAAVFVVGTFIGLDLAYAGKILPGVHILDLNLSGKTPVEAEGLIEKRLRQASSSPITLTHLSQEWKIDPIDFGFKIEPASIAANAYAYGREGNLAQKLSSRTKILLGSRQNRSLALTSIYQLDQEKLTTFLDQIALKVNSKPVEPKLVIKNTRATDFSPGVDGVEVNIDKSVELIVQNILAGNQSITLPLTTHSPKKKLADLNSQGINQLIAKGESNFTGSPKNRIHNIKTGAARFDGLIIPAGETFSFVQNLGDVDASTGYLPELVIKGDETTPEFGGGLCQVSTTAFRAILAGGLPVVERRNHSYRVAYYEPAGTDATIYQPYPDLKFTNDTPGSILMDTYIVGTKLYFDFYGTDIGRTGVVEAPYIYNVTAFPEPIYIDTATLPPGEIKKIDTAHRGADAIVYRKVYQDGKLVSTDKFTSHYIPWAAKYLRGVEDAQAVPTDLGNIENPTETLPATT